MINTEYVELEKPESTEFYDVDVQNRNMDKIDAKFKENELKKHTSLYAVCSTAADTATKVVEYEEFAKEKGTSLKVEFKNSNKAENPRLNVNGTIASITYKNQVIDADMLAAGKIYEFMWNGSSWTLVSQPVFDTAGAYFSTSNLGSGVTLSGMTSRKIARKTYAVMGTLSISLTQSNLAEFQTAWNTYGTVENWYQMLKLKHSTTKELTLESPRYVGNFRAFDNAADGQFYRKPLECSLAIDESGMLKISGNENYTFKAGDRLKVPFNFIFSE